MRVDHLSPETPVYGTPEHPHEYVALVDGRWLMWPAERGGWQYRRPTPTPDADALYALPPDLAEFALRATGAVTQ